MSLIPTRSRLCALIVVLLPALTASAHLQSGWTPDGSAPGLAWNLAAQTPAEYFSGGRVAFRLITAGTFAIPNETHILAIRHAFQTWEDETNAAIAFTRGTDITVSSAPAVEAGFSIGFTDAGENSQWGANLEGAIGLSTYTCIEQGDPYPITDTDIAFNRALDFTVTNSLEATALHEIGHSLGLGHTPFTQSEMGYVGGWQGGVPATGGQRLTSDDQIGLAWVYPADGYRARCGTLTGRVTLLGADVHLAQVSLFATNDTLVSATYSRAGRYRFDGLPPGTYVLRVFPTPLGSSGDSLHQQYETLSAEFRGGQPPTVFVTTAANDASNVVVSAGLVSTQNLAVAAGTPAMYATFSTCRSNTTTRWRTQALRLPRGATHTIGIDGGNLPTHAGETAEISLGGNGLAISNVTYTSTRFYFNLTIATNATPGPRPLFVRKTSLPGERHLIPGFIDIFDDATLTIATQAVTAATCAPPGATNVTLLPLAVTVGPADRVRLRDVSVAQAGSGNLSDFTRLALYLDPNTNGTVDPGESCIGTNTAAAPLRLDLVHTLDAGATTPLVLAGDLGPAAATGVTHRVSLPATGAVAWGVYASRAVSNLGGTVTGPVITVQPDPDSDRDALPDAWERQYFGNLTSVTTNSDSDRDGLADRLEYRAGTDPTNRRSLFALAQTDAAAQSADGLIIRWPGADGRTYAVDRATNLAAAPPFTPAFSNLPGHSPTTAVTDQNATATGPYYYRVRIE